MGLNPSWRLGSLALTSSPYAVPFGAEHGSPDTSTDVLASFLTAGDIEIGSHTGNRTVVLPILLQGSLSALAAAEAALIAESSKPQNTLLVDPGDGTAPAYQLTVFGGPGALVWNRDDVYEQNGYRSFTLTLRALPFVFSASETVTAPFTPPATVTSTVVDSGSSATGWTVYSDGSTTGTIASSGGAIVAGSSPSASTASFTLGAIRTGTAESLVTTPYVGIDQYVDASLGWTYSNVRVVIDGAQQAVVSAVALGSGFVRLWVKPAVTSFTSLAVFADVTPAPGMLQSVGVEVARVRIDQVTRSNSFSAVSTTKQLLRTLTASGSAPSTGSVAIEHSTSSLGDVLLYTCPGNATGYSPALRTLRVSGQATPTTDASTVSGAYDTLTGATPVVYKVPYSTLAEGEYLVMARVQTSTTTTVTCTAASVAGTTTVATQAISSTFAALAAWTFVRIGMLHLPLVDAGPNTSLTFSISRTGGALQLDELYLFNLTTGDLSQVACGTGTPAAGGSSNRLWVDSPSVENGGLGAMLRGFSSDRSDSFSAFPYSTAAGIHEFPAGPVLAFTVTSNADSASIGFRSRAAWMHTAAS